MTKEILHTRSVRYLSEGDEDIFFDWLNRIECVTSISGMGDLLTIEVERSAITDECLRELIALFSRYQVDLSQLANLATDEDRKGT